MFQAFYLHLSYNPLCLQPCGSDLIRRSGTERNAMIWGRWGRKREQVRARKSLFLFIVKISSRRTIFPRGPNQLALYQAVSQTSCHCSSLPNCCPFMSCRSRCLKGRGPYLHVLLACWQPALFPQLQRIVGF